MTEAEMTQATGLIARSKLLEGELARQRDSVKINDLVARLDTIRWTLQNEFGITINPWGGRAGPDGKVCA